MIRFFISLISILLISLVSGLHIELPDSLEVFTFFSPSNLLQTLFQGDAPSLKQMGEATITRVAFWKNTGLLLLLILNSLLMIYFLKDLMSSKRSGQ